MSGRLSSDSHCSLNRRVSSLGSVFLEQGWQATAHISSIWSLFTMFVHEIYFVPREIELHKRKPTDVLFCRLALLLSVE